MRRVLVTGASRGIGRAVAELLLADGREVVAMSRSGHGPPGACALAADLALADERATAIARAVEKLGSLDAIVCCAGMADHRPLALLDEAQLDAQLAIHVHAPLVLSRDLAAHLGGRAGSIVFVASTLALQGVAGTVAYSAAKGALVSATRTLAIELAPNVRVSCVAPGGVATEMVAGRTAELAALHPLGRIAEPAEIARTIVHVLDAGFMTGSIVTIDGGLTAR